MEMMRNGFWVGITLFAAGTLLGLQFWGSSMDTTDAMGSHPTCRLPVLEYTTGALDEVPANLYSDSVEWVVVDYLPVRNLTTPVGEYEGWVVLIQLIADGDDALEDFTVQPQGLAQVKFNGTWMLQADFERLLCSTSPV